MQEKLEKVILVPVLDKYEKMSLISMFLDVLDLIYAKLGSDEAG